MPLHVPGGAAHTDVVVSEDLSPDSQFFFVSAFSSQSSEKCQSIPNIPGKLLEDGVLKEGGKLWE